MISSIYINTPFLQTSSFLSPDTNKRTDEYGGSFENRVRFAKEVLTGIHVACGPDFIIGARIPGIEFKAC